MSSSLLGHFVSVRTYFIYYTAKKMDSKLFWKHFLRRRLFLSLSSPPSVAIPTW